LYPELTHDILAACFEVSNELGAGFLESVYHKALIIALQQKQLQVQSELPLDVVFRGQSVGNFYADLLVEGKVIVEIKAVAELTSQHIAQVLNYLNGTGIEVGLLVNFGTPKIEYRNLRKPRKKMAG